MKRVLQLVCLTTFLILILSFSSTLLSGCSSLLNRPPVAVIHASRTHSSLAPMEVVFDGTSSYDPDGTVIFWEWDFGDGGKGKGPVVSHVYERPGSYDVILQVIDDKGNVGSTGVVIYVGAFPTTHTHTVHVNLPAETGPALGTLKLISPVATSLVRSDGKCDVPLLTEGYQMIMVVNARGHPILMRPFFSDDVYSHAMKSVEHTHMIDVKTTAISLVLMNPLFSCYGEKVKKEIAKKVEDHSDYNKLVTLVAEAFRMNLQNPLLYDPLITLSCRIAEDVYKTMFPPVQHPRSGDFRWRYPSKDNGPFIATESPNIAYVDLINPKSIYYGVHVLNHDTKESLSVEPLFVTPATWLFLFYLGPGRMGYYYLGSNRVTFHLSKGSLNPADREKDLSIDAGYCANSVAVLFHLIDLVTSVNLPADARLMLKASKIVGLFVKIAEALKKDDPVDLLINVLFLLKETDLLQKLVEIGLECGIIKGSAQQLIELIGKAVPIINKILLAIEATDKLRFAYDLITAPGGGAEPIAYSVQFIPTLRQLTIIPVVKLQVSAKEVAVNEPIVFSCEASDPDGYIARILWDFGEGKGFQIDSERVQYTYARSGNYTVTVRVEDNLGSWAVDRVSITVKDQPNQPPVARLRAQPTSGPAPLSVAFDASASYDPDGQIVLYRWSFGDGGSREAREAFTQYTYSREGTFTAVLTVVDNRGATATAQVTITVTSPGCPDLAVTELWVEPAQFTPGQRVVLKFKIKNVGTSGSAAFRVVVTVDGREIDSGTIDALRPGQETLVQSDLTWPDGNCHTLAVMVDANNTVNECNEDNNKLSKSFCPTQGCVNEPRIWTDKNEYCIGDEARVYITITAPSYIDVWIVYPNGEMKYLARNRYLDDPTKTYFISAKASEPVGHRALYIKAIACGVEKTASSHYSVSSCQAPPSNLPNLVIADFQARGDTTDCPRGKIKFSFIVKNKGGTRSGRTTVFVHQEECRAVHIFWSAEVPELAPGDWIPFHGELVYCNDVGGMAVTLVATVDPRNNVQETNEQDNIGRVRVENPCTGELLPDLTIANVEITHARQCIDLSGEPIEMRFFVVVKNLGSIASPPTRLFCTFDCRDASLEIVDVPSLRPGQSVKLVSEYTTIHLYGSPTCMDANRNVVLRCVVDPENVVKERDEHNNVFQMRVHILPEACL